MSGRIEERFGTYITNHEMVSVRAAIQQSMIRESFMILRGGIVILISQNIGACEEEMAPGSTRSS